MSRKAASPRSVSAVVPAFQAARNIGPVLRPLLELERQKSLLEVIVVDDGSTDGTGRIARELGARVLVTPANCGPAAARNLGAEHARGDIVWFVDADVVVDAASLGAIRKALREPGVWAACGTHDDLAPARNFATRYKNLVHNYRTRTMRPEAALFWSGCGAVRRDKFLQLGGFDAEAFRVPSIEDIEFGYRIRDCGGRVLALEDVEATHLKDWTIRGIVATDIFDLALPWSRLLLSRSRVAPELTYGEVVHLAAAWALLLGLAASAASLVPIEVPVAAAVLTLAVNARLLVFLARAGDPVFALFAVAFHQIRYVYSMLAFAWGWWRSRPSREPAAELDLSLGTSMLPARGLPPDGRGARRI